jgi:hypothetical protein
MAIKTFTTGEVLTAADTNTFLANAGLDYITAVTVSSSATQTISNCFSSTWANYRIVIAGAQSNVAAVQLAIRLGTTNTGYYGSRYSDLYTGGSTTTSRTSNGTSYVVLQMTSNNDESMCTFDMTNPQLAKRTAWAGNFYGDGSSGWFGGTVADTTQYTNLTLLTISGTWSGTVRIYGYRQA